MRANQLTTADQQWYQNVLNKRSKLCIKVHILVYKIAAAAENAYGEEIQSLTLEESLTLRISSFHSWSNSVNHDKIHLTFNQFSFAEAIMPCFAAAVLLAEFSLITIPFITESSFLFYYLDNANQKWWRSVWSRIFLFTLKGQTCQSHMLIFLSF